MAFDSQAVTLTLVLGGTRWECAEVVVTLTLVQGGCPEGLECYFPFHTGLRFSVNARAPSFRSSERTTFWTAFRLS